MVEFKLVISDPKTGKSYQKEAKEDAATQFLGKKIGDRVKLDGAGLIGYEGEITGGSDAAGFPMRKDVPGSARKKILAVSGVGLTNKKKKPNPKKKGWRTMKGMRTKKTVAGNTVYEKTAQINLKIATYGREPLEKPAETAPEGEAKTKAPAAEEKPVALAEEKKE